MATGKVKAAAAAALFLTVCLLLFKDSFLPGKMLFGTDTVTIYMAFSVFAQRALHVYGSLPSWLPDIYLGMPMIGSSSLLFYYPTDLLFIALNVPIHSTYAFDLCLHMLAAASGMFLFLRRIRLGSAASFFGASAIMVSGYLLSYVYAGHWNNIKAGALIPFAFYFTHRALEKKSAVSFMLAAVMPALMMLATGMQIMAYTMLGLAGYAAYYLIFVEKDKKAVGRAGAGLGLTLVFIFLLSAPQLLPSLAYTNLSWRADVSYKDFISWSFHPGELISFFIPGFFGLFNREYWGFMPFTLTSYYFGITCFLLLGFLNVKGPQRKNIFFFAAAIAAFTVLAFGGYTFIYGIFYHLPVFKQFRNPSRFFYVATFFAVALASIGLDSLLNEKDEKPRLRALKITAAVTGAFIILFALSVSSGGMDSLLASLHYKIKSSAMPAGILDSTRKLIKDGLLSIFLVSASFFVVAFFAIKGRIKGAFTAAFIIAAINCADAGRVMSRFITFEDYNRFVARDNAIASAIRNAGGIKRCLNFEQAFGPNRNIYYGIESLRGMHGLMPSDYMEMEKAGVFGNIQVNRLFNITHYLSDREMAVPGIEKVYESSGIILYMDTLAKNRVFFAGSLRKAGSKKQALDIMKQGFDGSYSIAEPDFPMGEYGLRQGSVSVTSYSPNRVAAVVESAEGGAVVHASAYYSEWKAKIDGRNTPVYRVNYMSMAVQAPPGRHEIEFYYDDSSTRTGIFLLLTGVLILTGAAFASRRAG